MAADKKASTSEDIVSFETSLEKLEELVSTMETGDISLEESLKCFEEGIKLTRKAQKALIEAEQKVQSLMESEGEMVIEPFQEPEE
ncbi:MAG: exodeoxyribonuclease VII small subunit [Halioglobus sp.]